MFRKTSTLFALALLASIGRAQGTTTYLVTLLEPDPAATETRADVINDGGWVIGSSFAPDPTDATLSIATGYISTGSKSMLLTPAAGDATSYGRTLTFQRVACGRSGDNPTLWFGPGNTHTLELLAGSVSGLLNAANLHGFVVGHCEDAAGTSTPVLWPRDRGPVALPIPSGFISARTSGINDTGFIIGSASDSTGVLAAFAIDSQGTQTVIPNVSLSSINNRDVAAGFSPGSFMPIFYEDGQVVPVPLPPGALFGGLNDLNDQGIAVGFGVFLSGGAAVVTDGSTYFTDLHTLLEPGTATGVSLISAFGINEEGQICGTAADAAGNVRGFLLTPVSGAQSSGAPTVETPGTSISVLERPELFLKKPEHVARRR